MKTFHIATQNQNLTREHVRLGIILMGIMTAIICLLALLFEARSIGSELSVPGLIETSKVDVPRFSVEVLGKAMVSAIWPF